MVWAALGLHGLGWVLAFLALDTLFRRIDLTPAGFGARLRYYQLGFAGLALVASLGLGALQVGAAGWPGAALALLGPLPWWVLWRFGWRKQFTFLYKADGGQPIEKPDP